MAPVFVKTVGGGGETAGGPVADPLHPYELPGQTTGRLPPPPDRSSLHLPGGNAPWPPTPQCPGPPGVVQVDHIFFKVQKPEARLCVFSSLWYAGRPGVPGPTSTPIIYI